MHTIATDVPVSQSVHHSKMAERIEVLFGMKSLGGPKNIVLDGCPDPPMAWGVDREGTFDAAFVKLLWFHVVALLSSYRQLASVYMGCVIERVLCFDWSLVCAHDWLNKTEWRKVLIG